GRCTPTGGTGRCGATTPTTGRRCSSSARPPCPCTTSSAPAEHRLAHASSYPRAGLVRCTLRARHERTSSPAGCVPDVGRPAPGAQTSPAAPAGARPTRARTPVPSSYGARYELGTHATSSARTYELAGRLQDPKVSRRVAHHPGAVPTGESRAPPSALRAVL